LSDFLGSGFQDFLREQRKQTAWSKARPVAGFDPTVWRYDEHNNVIKWSDYGDRTSDYGWEIDHRFPTALGGIDVDSNCRALHWRANASAGGYLSGLF
jgi:hypothetical protein